jgi:hypothetical protein
MSHGLCDRDTACSMIYIRVDPLGSDKGGELIVDPAARYRPHWSCTMQSIFAIFTLIAGIRRLFGGVQSDVTA